MDGGLLLRTSAVRVVTTATYPKGSLGQAMKMKLNKKMNCSQTNDEAILSHFSGVDVIIQELKYITVFAW